MKKAGLILKSGVFVAATLFFVSTASAQSNGKHISGTQEPPVKNANYNPKMATQKKAAVAAASQGSGARNCEPKSSMKPYSIRRADFDKLPADRKKFVLENSNRYTIVD